MHLLAVLFLNVTIKAGDLQRNCVLGKKLFRWIPTKVTMKKRNENVLAHVIQQINSIFWQLFYFFRRFAHLFK